jgi:hypothetical protein
MSKMPDMVKMENLFWQAAPEHEELHTDIEGYDESLSFTIAKEEKLIVEMERLIHSHLQLPPPEVIRRENPPEHYELHTDTSDSGCDE